jgi:phosphate transport system protein
MSIGAQRHEYTKNLELAQDRLIILASLVERSVRDCIEAVRIRDMDLARAVIANDDEIDTQELAIQDHCIELIAMQAPMAADLRQIISVLLIAAELERIGDYAEGIAKIGLQMGQEPPLKPLIDIPRMSDIATGMLHTAMLSFTERDVERAFAVRQKDDEIDDLYQQVLRELLSYMIEDPGSIRRATYLIWIAHTLERIADRSVNIAERAHYFVTGVQGGLNPPKSVR